MVLRCEIRSVWTRSSVTIQGRNATLLLPTPNGSLRKQKALLVGDTELKASSQGKPPESLHRQQQRTGSPKEVDDFCGWNELLGLFCAVAVVGELLGTGHIAASGGGGALLSSQRQGCSLWDRLRARRGRAWVWARLCSQQRCDPDRATRPF